MSIGIPKNLVRTHMSHGMMVHRAECGMAQRGKAVPWNWADTVGSAEVMQAIVGFNYRRCRRCRPLPEWTNLGRLGSLQ